MYCIALIAEDGSNRYCLTSPVDHQLSASSSIDDPSSLHSAMTDSLTQGTTNSDIKGARHGDGDVHTNAHNDSSTEDGQTITVQLTKSGESRGNSQGTVV